MKRGDCLSDSRINEYQILIEGYRKDLEESKRRLEEVRWISNEIQRLERRQSDILKEDQIRFNIIRNGVDEIHRALLSSPNYRERYLELLQEMKGLSQQTCNIIRARYVEYSARPAGDRKGIGVNGRCQGKKSCKRGSKSA
jgi:hypothetical protein